MRLTLISKKSRGFSLMELMVIVSILSVLSAIAIPNYLKHRTKGMIGQATKELKTLQRAIQDLGHDTGMWPGTLSERVVRPAGTRNDSGKEYDDLSGPEMGLDSTDGTYPDWQGPYYTGPFVDPWGKNYAIDYDYHLPPDDIEVPVVVSYGPDKCCFKQYNDDDIIIILPSGG